MLASPVMTILAMHLPGAGTRRDPAETTESPEDTGASTNSRVVILIFVGGLLRILSYLFSRNVGGDALERAALTARWLEHPGFKMVFGGYPPGHFWLMGGFSLLVPDVTVAARLLSLVLGIGSLFLAWKLAHILYGPSAAMMSLAVFVFYSLHVGYSGTSSSEVPCAFFVLLGLFFFFNYFYGGHKQIRYLVVSGIALSIAGSIRFEPWMIMGALVVVMPLLWVRLCRREKMKDLLVPFAVFAGLGGAWPVVMMAYCWRSFGDPMFLLTSTHSRMAQVLATAGKPLGYELALVPSVLFLSLSPIAFCAAVYAIVRSRRNPLSAALAGVAVFLLMVQLYEVWHGGFLVVARYSIIPGSMLAVISGDGLQEICRRFLPGRGRLAQLSVIVFLIMNVSAILVLSEIPSRVSDKFASISPRLRATTRIQGVGDYLRAHMGEQDALVIDDYNVESNIIADAAGLPLLAGRRAYLVSSANEINVSEYIKRNHPRFLVYSDKGVLRGLFRLPEDCSAPVDVGGVEFYCRYSNQIYKVYELSYR